MMEGLIKEFYTLQDGTQVPKIGFGCYNPKNEDFVRILLDAIDAGYRYFDTASIYATERDLAKALKISGINRSEVQIASKAWIDEMGYEETKAAIERSLNRLDTDYLDAFFIHWPKANEEDEGWKERCLAAWKAMTEYKAAGKIKHLGVCNFLPHHLLNLMNNSDEKPEINQMECHIGYSQELAASFCKENGILVQPWGPLGRGMDYNNPVILSMMKKYDKTFSQIALRFLIQKGYMPIPKSATKSHMIDNADVFGFEIDEEDIWLMSCIPQQSWCNEHPDIAIPKAVSNFNQ